MEFFIEKFVLPRQKRCVSWKFDEIFGEADDSQGVNTMHLIATATSDNNLLMIHRVAELTWEGSNIMNRDCQSFEEGWLKKNK